MVSANKKIRFANGSMLELIGDGSEKLQGAKTMVQRGLKNKNKKEMKTWRRMIQEIYEEGAWFEDDEQKAMLFIDALVRGLLERVSDLQVLLNKKAK